MPMQTFPSYIPLFEGRGVGTGVLRTSPVGAAPPAAINPELEVIHHRIFKKEDNAICDLGGL